MAALCIYFMPWTGYLDPICTILFSLIVLYTTFRILGEVFSVLMEGGWVARIHYNAIKQSTMHVAHFPFFPLALPQGVDFNVVKETFLSVDGIRAIHNIRIWGLTTEKFALSAHLAIGETIK